MMNEVDEGSDIGSLLIDIVTEIATRKGVGVCERHTPLAEVIDSEALETIVEESQIRTAPGRTRVEFEYCNHRIVGQDGDIQIQAIADAQQPPNPA